MSLKVIQRAREAGVTKIMVTGTSLHSTKEALRLTRLYPGTLYSTAGNDSAPRMVNIGSKMAESKYGVF